MQCFFRSTTHLQCYWTINFTFIEISAISEGRAYKATFVPNYPEPIQFSEYRTKLDLIFITSEALSSRS